MRGSLSSLRERTLVDGLDLQKSGQRELCDVRMPVTMSSGCGNELCHGFCARLLCSIGVGVGEVFAAGKICRRGSGNSRIRH